MLLNYDYDTGKTQYKGDINMKNNDGYTALMYASIYGHTEIVELLLKILKKRWVIYMFI